MFRSSPGPWSVGPWEQGGTSRHTSTHRAPRRREHRFLLLVLGEGKERDDLFSPGELTFLQLTLHPAPKKKTDSASNLRRRGKY